MEIGELFGLAMLAVLGSLITRKFRIPKRIGVLVPVVLAILMVWTVSGLASVGDVMKYGIVTGLLAGGMLYILLGLTSRL